MHPMARNPQALIAICTCTPTGSDTSYDCRLWPGSNLVASTKGNFHRSWPARHVCDAGLCAGHRVWMWLNHLIMNATRRQANQADVLIPRPSRLRLIIVQGHQTTLKPGMRLGVVPQHERASQTQETLDSTRCPHACLTGLVQRLGIHHPLQALLKTPKRSYK